MLSHQASIGQDPPSFDRGPINRGAINRMVTSGGLSLEPLKHIILIILGALWVYQPLGDMPSIIVSNLHFGKLSAARAMAIVSLHLLTNVTNHPFSY